MNIYEVSWKIKGGGAYVWPNVGGGGDYHKDIHGKEIITARTAKIAKSVVEAVRPGAKVERPKMICPAE